jgi:hypothetical protein
MAAKCGAWADIDHLGTLLCDAHWAEYCEQDEGKRKKMKLKKTRKPGVCAAMRCKESTDSELCPRHQAMAEQQPVQGPEQQWSTPAPGEQMGLFSPPERPAPEEKLEVDLAEKQRSLADDLEAIKEFVFETPDDRQFAVDEMNAAKQLGAEYESKRKEITKPLMDSKRKVDSLFRPVLDLCNRLERAWKDRILADRQQQKEAAAAKLEAAEYAETPDEAHAALVAASETAASAAPPKGLQYRKKVAFIVEDFASVPDAYKKVDEAKVRQDAKRVLKGELDIPGIQVFEAEIAVGSLA